MKFEKLLMIIFILTNIFLVTLIYIDGEKNYTKNLAIKIEEKKNIFDIKTGLIYSSVLDLKNEESILEYEENPTPYNRLKIFKLLKSKNNLFSKFGYDIAFANKKSNVFITSNGVIDKNHFLKNIGIYSDLETLPNIIEYKNFITILISPSKYEAIQDGTWIISIDKNIFFSDLKIDGLGEWSIERDHNYESPYSFRNNYYDFNLVFNPIKADILPFIILSIFKVLFITTIVFICILKIFKFIQTPILYINQKKNFRDYILGINQYRDIESFTERFKDMKLPLNLILVEFFDSNTDEFFLGINHEIKNYLMKYLNSLKTSEVIDIDYRNVLFLIPKEEFNRFSELLAMIEEKYKMKLIFTVSNEITDLKLLPKEYIKCKVSNRLQNINMLGYKKIINKISDLKLNREKESDIEMKNRIEKYLEDNYAKDFSLEDLSDYLGFSFRYTSLLFKKNMGDNFKNYLNLFRIKKAKEIIRANRGVKIKDVAEMVGYNSSNTFIRIFKKYEGVSPARFFLDNINLHDEK